MKSIKHNLFNQARELYLNTDNSLQDIALMLDIKVNSLYRRSQAEKWSLLKDTRIEEALNEKNELINERKVKNLAFYEEIMDRCKAMLNENSNLKEITETHILAETRFFLLAKENLTKSIEASINAQKEKNSILEEIAKM